MQSLKNALCWGLLVLQTISTPNSIHKDMMPNLHNCNSQDILKSRQDAYTVQLVQSMCTPAKTHTLMCMQGFHPDIDLSAQQAYLSFHMADLTASPQACCAPLLSKLPLCTVRTYKVWPH